MTSALAKKDEKLKKKEKLLMEESVNQDSMKKELEGLKKEISSLHTLNKRLDQALVKKDKQYTEVSEQLSTFKQVHAQIFSLSKTVSSTGDNE
jgi:archaellum component FlaC